MKDIPKIVGGVTDACTRLAAMLYRGVVTGVRTVSSPRVAELAKLYENVVRNVNIALANESDPYVPVARLADAELKAVPASSDRLGASDCVLVLTDHPDFDYAEAVERAPLVVDARNATWGLAVPEGRVVRL